MELGDVQAAGRAGRCRRLRRRRRVGAAAVGGRFLAQLQLRARLLLLLLEELVELLARGEPVLVVADEDVVDRQLAGDRVLPRGVGAEADAAALQGHQRFLQGGQRAAEPLHLGALDAAAVARLEDRVLQARLEELGVHLLFGLHVVGLLLVRDLEQRRLGHVDVPAADQVVHLPVEEGQQQRADVRAVDVGVGHDDDLAVAALGEIDLLADARADGGDDAADFLVGQHLVLAGLVGVDDLAAQGEDGLELAVAAALGAAAGRIALDEVQLAAIDDLAGAVAELAGQAAAGQGALALAEEGLGLAGRLAGLGRQHRLGDHLLGRLGMLFEVLAPGSRPRPS